MPYLIFALMLAGIVFLTVMTYKQSETAAQSMQALTAELGLVFDEGGFFRHATLKGVYRGVSLNIYEESRHTTTTNRHARTYTLFRVPLIHVDVPDELMLFGEGLSSKLGKLFGKQDIQVGNPEFDKKFIIRGESSDEVRAFLSRPGVQDYLLAIAQLGGEFKLENSVLCLEFYDTILGQHTVLRHRIELLVNCAHAMAQTDLQQLPTNSPAPFAPASLPRTPPPIADAPPKLDNVGDSW